MTPPKCSLYLYPISSKKGRPLKISRFENKPRYFSRHKKNRPTSKISREAVKSLHCTPTSCTIESDICELFENKHFVIRAPTRKSFSAKFKAEVWKYITEKGCSNSAAARHFGIDEKNIRRWKTQSGSLHAVIKNGFSKAKQLPGSGRRPLSEDLEELVYQWIVSKRLQKQRVTRKEIQQKAVELYNSTIKGELEFQASNGRLEKFMSRYSLSLRKKQQLSLSDLQLTLFRRFIDLLFTSKN